MTGLKTIDLNLLPLETLSEMANEAGEQVERNAKATVQKAIDAGRYLTAAKEQLPHGQWGGWLGANWNYSQSLAGKYMQISNSECVTNLKNATSVNEALRMISESKPEKQITPRSERISNRVEVAEVDDDQGEKASSATDENAVPAAPKTNTKHSSATKKAKEAGTTPPQVVTPQFVDEPQELAGEIQFRHEQAIAWLHTMELAELIAVWFGPDIDAKKQAKTLRKAADKLDPPTKFQKPDLDEVSEYFRELKAVDPDSFFDFYESKGWVVGKVSMKDWRASARKWVRENNKGNNNGNTEAKSLSSNGRPAVERAKITYR